jgi:hypothetical protein
VLPIERKSQLLIVDWNYACSIQSPNRTIHYVFRYFVPTKIRDFVELSIQRPEAGGYTLANQRCPFLLPFIGTVLFNTRESDSKLTVAISCSCDATGEELD